MILFSLELVKVLCWSTSSRTKHNRLYSAVLQRTSYYSYCRTFRTPTTQYSIMILARRGHQTAQVQYVETYEGNSGSRKRNPCVRKLSKLNFSAWKGRFHVEFAMFSPLHTVSAWVQHGFWSWVPCNISILPTFWNHAESMRAQKKICLPKSPFWACLIIEYKNQLMYLGVHRSMYPSKNFQK